MYTFPGRSLLDRQEAARYLGITPLRLRLLEIGRCGPVPLSPGRYRTDALDVYRSELFLKAHLPVEEANRRAVRALSRTDAQDAPLDPFVNMATRHDLLDVGMFIGGRAGIFCGLIMIVLSHTPLSHVLTHVLR
ncbi:hypothetical protein [Acetobacter conturbans]|uniref:hypothetical protein n=1 Tax=Acetobacter conturbans TaxID=1737472 RepID=UPI0030CAF532